LLIALPGQIPNRKCPAVPRFYPSEPAIAERRRGVSASRGKRDQISRTARMDSLF
jgi:hypothetical protein